MFWAALCPSHLARWWPEPPPPGQGAGAGLGCVHGRHRKPGSFSSTDARVCSVTEDCQGPSVAFREGGPALQLAEAVGEQQVWGQRWVLLLRWGSGGRRGGCGHCSSWGRWGGARRGPHGWRCRAPGDRAGKGQWQVRHVRWSLSLTCDRAHNSVGGLSWQEKVPGCPAERHPGKPLPGVKRESFDSFFHLLTQCVKV